MFLLKTSLFSVFDLWGLPVAILIVILISRIYLRNENQETRRFFRQGLRLRIIMLIAFTAIMQFYYRSGDSYRYYISIQDMRLAISDNAIGYFDLLGMEKSSPNDLLYSYFEVDELGENHYYMSTVPNFTVPKVGTLLSYPVLGSYLGIGLFFSFYGLLGALQIYRVFAREFPGARRLIALACFFIPTVAFWSSGILKDSLTFGATGFLFASCYNIFTRRGSLISALLAILLSSYLLYTIKPYILLALAPAIVLLVMIQYSRHIRGRQLRSALMIMLLVGGVFFGFLLYQNLTSDETLARYNSEVILESIEQQRDVYTTEAMQRSSGSNFSLGSNTLALQLPLGLVATYFRPFPWEMNSPIMIMNVLESLFCLFLLIYTVRRLGFAGFARALTSHPLILFCLVFSFLFGAAVGTSTGNFGSLVRYKIPGMPFFLLLFLVTLHLKGQKLPPFFRKWKLFKES